MTRFTQFMVKCQSGVTGSRVMRVPAVAKTIDFGSVGRICLQCPAAPNSWRGARVVERARLESECTVTPYRGFESLPLRQQSKRRAQQRGAAFFFGLCKTTTPALDRKSTRLNSSHVASSYAGFCLK